MLNQIIILLVFFIICIFFYFMFDKLNNHITNLSNINYNKKKFK